MLHWPRSAGTSVTFWELTSPDERFRDTLHQTQMSSHREPPESVCKGSMEKGQGERYVSTYAKAASVGSIRGSDGGMGALRWLLLGAIACAALAMVAPKASAATADLSYGYTGDIGTPDSPTFGIAGMFNSIAVSSDDGNVFIPRNLEEAVDVIDPSGTSVVRAHTSGFWPGSVAVSADGETLFITNHLDLYGARAVVKYTSDGAPTPTYTEDPLWAVALPGAPNGIAVDPSTGNLLVAAGGVHRFDAASGALLSSFDGSSAPRGPFSASSIAVAPNGDIYVVAGPTRIEHMGGDGSWKGELKVPDGGGGRVPTAIAVNPQNGDVAVSLQENGDPLIELYTAANELKDTIPVPFPLVPGDCAAAGVNCGLAFSPDGSKLYAAINNGAAHVFQLGTRAGVDPPSPSSITTAGFHLDAEVDPGEEGGGLPSGSAMHFEYRLAGTSSWISTPDQSVGAKGSYGADITGLDINRTYEVRAVASNSLIVHNSAIVKVTTLATKPVVGTSAATDVTETSAVLNGTINPIGLQGTYHFEYGTTTAYGSRVPTSIDAVAGGSHEVKSFSRLVAGLAPGTTYHFRLVATNALGTSEGIDRTFTTTAAGAVPTRFYEQVTPAEKNGATVKDAIGFQAQANGEGFSYLTLSGPQSSPLNSRYMALRGGADWDSGIPLDPPLRAFTYKIVTQSTLAVSQDFTHTLVASNRALAPGAVEGGDDINLYVVDVATNSYHLVAGVSGVENADYTFLGASEADKFMAGAPDFSWIVFNSQVPLVAGAPAESVYRWSEAGGLELVSVLPDGEMTKVRHMANRGEERTVSVDGSRIYFSAFGGSEEGVFLREGDDVKAISVSEVPGDPDTPRAAYLLGMSVDGRYAFFGSQVEGAKLTADAPGEEGDLYRYDAANDSLEYLGAQALVKMDGVGRPAFGQLGTGADGRTIYFNARTGTGAEDGELAVWRDDVVHIVDSTRLKPGETFISPDGRYVAFVRDRVLDKAVRLYDAETNELSCASCLSDGTAPVEAPEASALPALETAVSNRIPQAVDNGGAVYFDTPGRLVAADVNGTADVYAFRDGQARLISPGNAPFNAAFADISADGRDVYFNTAQKLVGRDNDEARDIYDARIGGGLPAQSPPAPQECLRDDCKATPGAGPEVPFGGSEALSGPGNVREGSARKRCAKGAKTRKVKGKTRCVKQSRVKRKGKKNNTKRRQAR